MLVRDRVRDRRYGVLWVKTSSGGGGPRMNRRHRWWFRLGRGRPGTGSPGELEESLHSEFADGRWSVE